MERTESLPRDDSDQSEAPAPSLTALVLGWAVGTAAFAIVYRSVALLRPGGASLSGWSVTGLALTTATAQVACGLAFHRSTRGLTGLSQVLAILPAATFPMPFDLAKRGNSPAVIILACAGMGLFLGLTIRAGLFLLDLGRRALGRPGVRR
ncbi:hypothetical protein [Paludisphaera soli]|uniref:hypothetical protein n=1 Tax=Paludisphaera soli TaxID=2712865 RepID=UPI0013E99EB5|nr:hypothetical protein [Paludisphaera soli]